MNKTVNINLAGIFFHIDEDAYLKLQRYLEAIKRSFTDSQGRSEIVADIEARIAELFTERKKHDKQVIGNTEVDEVISIMGQPEDYLVDDEIFEDEPGPSGKRGATHTRKLFRDTDNSYIGGVSSGLGHYFGIDPVWIRLIWVLLFFGAGTGVILYILLWILIPEALTTTDKLLMKGEKVNISNIEKKIRDGFDSVSENLQKTGDKLKDSLEHASDNISESVKRVDFTKQGGRIKSGSKSFFDTVADVLLFVIMLFAKFIGLLLIFIGATTLIALFVGLFFVGIVDGVHIPSIDWLDLSQSSGMPLWGISTVVFLFLGIISFFIFYLGLKILIKNLKSIGLFAKSALMGIWLLCLIGIIAFSVKQGLSYKEDAMTISTQTLDNIKSNDTLVLSMRGNDYYAENFHRSYGFDRGFDENGDKITYSQGVRLLVKSTRDSVAKIKVTKSAKGYTQDVAKDRTRNISYQYDLIDQELQLDNHFVIPNDEKSRSQEVEVTVYLPLGSILYADENTQSFHYNHSRYYNDILQKGSEEQYLEIKSNSTKCLDCPNEDSDSDLKVNIDLEGDASKLQFNEDGFELKNNNLEVKINDDGMDARSKKVNIKINEEDGIKITSKKGSQTNE